MARLEDHPRIRGEHFMSASCCALMLGSSPHTRGALAHPKNARHGERIIPAYAGSTFPDHPFHVCKWDHPRIRGEHTDKTEALGLSQGSSPHTRGALSSGTGASSGSGIIPAYAGSTASRISVIRPMGGSSPHTRGARSAWTAPGLRPGIIPAYAGSTETPHGGTLRPPDHPRIRGEHGRRSGRSRWFAGSSPHTRGAPPTTTQGFLGVRIIPAYAGST